MGVMMEDGEEEEDDDNYVPPEYSDAATGEAAEDQEEPVPDDDDLRRVIVDARDAMRKSKGEAEVRSHVRGSQKMVVPQLRRWQHKAWYRTGIAAVEGRECCG